MKHKVVFLFMSKSSASPNSTKRIYPKNFCGVQYDKFNDECYFKLFHDLLRHNIIDDLKVFYESNVDPGMAKWIKHPNAYCEVIPEIRFVREYIDKDTIIFVRGGFKHWLEFLLPYKGKNWLIIYAANTGREKWPIWDIVLDDIGYKNEVDKHGRYFFPFLKPVNEEIFKPLMDSKISYDLCVGASHIHDKKGQWKVVDAISYYRKKYGNIKIILPGSPRGGINTREMYNKFNEGFDVSLPGYVSRQELMHIFNQSKYYITLGTHGQNDRGVLEAYSCGTEPIIGNPEYNTPFLKKFKMDGFDNYSKPKFVADKIKEKLDQYCINKRELTYQSYLNDMSYQEKVLPRMIMLFIIIQHFIKNGIQIDGYTKEMLKDTFRMKIEGEGFGIR
jgi:glycosyltransferase involved in cell wall biosynthesis